VEHPTRIVILGGGFGALNVARHLEAALRVDDRVEATLISRNNYLLFSPMLAEVAAGALAADHAAVPLRSFLRRVVVRQGEVTAADLDRRTVTMCHSATGQPVTLPYDDLVLALGSVASYHHVPGAAEHTLGFKTLADAAAARGRAIDCFEQAAVEPDSAVRRALLTFVVAGGGYTGVELAAALADFLRDLRRYYPTLAREPLRLVLAHHGQRLLEELDEGAAAYTLRLLRRMGIAVRLSTGVSAVAADSVELSPGGTLPTRTVFWTAGVAPSPFVEALPLPKDAHGAVIVDQHLAVPDHPGIWALGDCAHVPNRQGGTYGPTAQNAEQEAGVVAHNILASLRGEPLRDFNYRSRGMLASLGHRTAVGQVFGLHFSGLPAWFLWRTAYLAMLPSRDRRTRVAMDWLLDLLLPPNIVSSLYPARLAAPAAPAESETSPPPSPATPPAAASPETAAPPGPG
jgi:NADH dehydrogenase